MQHSSTEGSVRPGCLYGTISFIVFIFLFRWSRQNRVLPCLKLPRCQCLLVIIKDSI